MEFGMLFLFLLIGIFSLFENTKAALEKQINDEREKSKTISNNLSQLKKDLINLLV